MYLCDVCKKKVLLPVRIDESKICKTCFSKVNGVFWKYRRFERYHTADKKRLKVIARAEGHGFPIEVIQSINQHFFAQMNKMRVCEACGDSTATFSDLGDANICQRCMSKVQTAEWWRTDYINREEVEAGKQRILRTAIRQNFPEKALKAIELFFEQKNGSDWYYTLDGGAGQVLKVYSTYCTITTTDGFDAEKTSEELAEMEGEAQAVSHTDDELFTSGDLANLASGILRKGIIKGSIGLVASKAVNMVKKSYDEDHPHSKAKKKISVVNGERKLPYSRYELTHLKDLNGDSLGYLRFGSIDTKQTEVMFFFKACADGKVLKEMKTVCAVILECSAKVVEEMDKNRTQKTKKSTSEIATDILKYKELLDVGAITQEEYDEKKKQLLK